MSSWDEYHGLMQAITSLWRICWYLQKECSGRGELTDKHKSSKNITAGKTLTFWPSFMEQLEGKPRAQFSAAAYPSSHTFIRGMSILHSSGSITWRFSQAAPHSCDRTTTGWQSNQKHILIILKKFESGIKYMKVTWFRMYIISFCWTLVNNTLSLVGFPVASPHHWERSWPLDCLSCATPTFHATQELFLVCFL